MASKTVTKSIRLTQEEAQEAARITRLLYTSSESSLIKDAFRRGFMEMKLEAAVARYTKRDLSIGEVADLYGISPADLTQELVRRKIKIIDIPVDVAKENLSRLMKHHALAGSEE